jgi:hypothetical protein
MEPNGTLGRVMESAEQFREYAEECLGWAKTARSDQERETFLQMARTWMEVAMLAADVPVRAGTANDATA